MSLLKIYRQAGCRSVEEVLALATSRGPAALAEVRRALAEAGRESSTAMLVLPASPPGKNVCALARSILANRSKLIVVAQGGGMDHGGFERMMRASMPDCEKKLRIMDAGDSLADAVSSAERNRHYRPSQALEVFCDPQRASEFNHEISSGQLKFDPTVIQITPTAIPRDDAEAIRKAVTSSDLDALHRVLDPHVFSSAGGIGEYTSALTEDKDFDEDMVVHRLDNGRLDEFGTGAPGSGASGPPQMRGSNSSSWSSGMGALKAPQNNVPEDENADEHDIALDWGPGRVSGASA